MKKNAGAVVGVLIVAGLVAAVILLSISLSSANDKKKEAQEKYRKVVSDLQTVEKNAKTLNNNYLQMVSILNKEHAPNAAFLNIFRNIGTDPVLVVSGIMSARGASYQEFRKYNNEAMKIIQ